MVDSVDTLPDDRVVINVSTECSIPQALAEGIIKDENNPKDRRKALKPSSDYMNKIWIHQQQSNITVVIHVESGTVQYLHQTCTEHPEGQTYNMPEQSVELKEHEFSHLPWHAKHNLDVFQHMWTPERPTIDQHVKLYQQQFIISNRSTVKGARLKYYERGPINWNIRVVKLITEHVVVSTVSRKCELHVDYKHAWEQCRGALINKSPENQIDSIDQIKQWD